MTTAVTYLCPSCGASMDNLAEVSAMSSQVICAACGWVGVENQLLAAALNRAVNASTDMTQPLVNDLRKLLVSGLGVHLYQFLVRWGFIDKNNMNARVLARYISKIANATLAAIIKERIAIDAESSHDN